MFFSDVFWGLCVIAIGFNILLDAFFGISIPLFRVGLALFCIYSGLQLLSEPLFKKNYFSFKKQRYFQSNTITDYTITDYAISFGEQSLDFSHAKLTNTKKITISTTFGRTLLTLNSALPTKIITHINFGEIKYNNVNKESENVLLLGPQDQESLLIIEAYVNFGTLEIKNI